jgi:hypothetical protein
LTEYSRPYASVQYGNGRRRYEVREDDRGWFLYYDLADWLQAERLVKSAWYIPTAMPADLAPYTVRQTGRDWTDDIVPGDQGALKGLRLQHYIQDMDYNVASDEAGSWEWSSTEPGDWPDGVDWPPASPPTDEGGWPGTAPEDWPEEEAWPPSYSPSVIWLGNACRYFYTFSAECYDPLGLVWRTIGDASKQSDNFEDYWDFKKSADGLFVEMIQKQSAYGTFLNNQPILTHIWCEQEYGLCPNLWWAFGVRRQATADDVDAFLEDNPDILDEVDNLLCTCFYFGGMDDTNPHIPDDTTYYKWMLLVPISGKPVLCEGRPTAWSGDGSDFEYSEWRYFPVKLEGASLKDQTAKSMATDGATYIVGALGDNIVVSELGSDDFAFYRVPNAAQPIIPSGGVHVTNFPGQCALWMAPVKFDPGFFDGANEKSVRLRVPEYQYPNYNEPRIGYYMYGWTLRGWSSATETYRWPDTRPAWWPKFTLWPPKGPPGVWPSTAPYDWPEDEEWPPRYVATVDNPVPPPATVEINLPREVPDPVLDYPSYVSGGGVYFDHWAADAGTPPQSFLWKLSIEPITYNPPQTQTGRTTLLTHTTPFIQGVSLWQNATVTDNGVDAPDFAALPTPHVLDIHRGIGDMGGVDGSYDLVVTNREENVGFNPATAIRMGSTMRVTVGAKMADGTLNSFTIGDFVVAEKTFTRKEAGFTLADYLQMLALDKWTDGRLNFRLWTSKFAITWLLNHCGFGEDWYDLEDIGTYLTDISPQGTQWLIDPGEPIGQILAKIAYMGQEKAAIWCDGFRIKTGCPYCRTKRTAATLFTHQNNGWNSSGCRAADIARAGGEGVDRTIIALASYDEASLIIAEGIDAEETGLRSSEFATRITIGGRDEFGFGIQQTLVNLLASPTDDEPTSAHIGWNINHYQGEDNLKTWTDLFSRALHVFNQIGVRHLNLKRIVLPLTATEDHYMSKAAAMLWEGSVVKVLGGRGVGSNGKLFRVIQAAHNLQEMRTTLFVKEMVGPYG